jgi:osmotically-inducible protein OsmY
VTIRPRVNVTKLSEDIVHALNRSLFVDPNAISVSVDGGIVRLAGTVHSLHERQVATMTAWSAPGTIAVENNIVIA